MEMYIVNVETGEVVGILPADFTNDILLSTINELPVDYYKIVTTNGFSIDLWDIVTAIMKR